MFNFFNEISERFQAPGFNYGDVACCNSIMMMIICLIVILGIEYIPINLSIVKAFIILSQFMQVVLELYICCSEPYQNIKLFFIIQPVPFLIALVLYVIKKISMKMLVLFCVVDYILFIGKEYILNTTDPIGFHVVFQGTEAGVIKLLSCILFVLIFITSDNLSSSESYSELSL